MLLNPLGRGAKRGRRNGGVRTQAALNHARIGWLISKGGLSGSRSINKEKKGEKGKNTAHDLPTRIKNGGELNFVGPGRKGWSSSLQKVGMLKVRRIRKVLTGEGGDHRR